MSDAEKEKVEEIWVDLYEAAEAVNFNLSSMRKLAHRISQQPEEEREIRIRKRTSRWELWLPDLVSYVQRPMHGPRPKRKSSA